MKNREAVAVAHRLASEAIDQLNAGFRLSDKLPDHSEEDVEMVEHALELISIQLHAKWERWEAKQTQRST